MGQPEEAVGSRASAVGSGRRQHQRPWQPGRHAIAGGYVPVSVRVDVAATLPALPCVATGR